MQETANGKIHKLEVTDDTLTSRGGLAFFVKYLEAIGIVGLLLHKFAGIKKSIKGVSVRNLFLQVLYFFFKCYVLPSKKNVELSVMWS